MKAALRNVGIQLSPQEMCEVLQQADLDGGYPHPWPFVLLHFWPWRMSPVPTDSVAWSYFKVPSSRKPALINTSIPWPLNIFLLC